MLCRVVLHDGERGNIFLWCLLDLLAKYYIKILLKAYTALLSIVFLHWWSANGDIIATSLINECLRGEGGDELRNPYGDPCTKKLVVAMTADTEEVI